MNSAETSAGLPATLTRAHLRTPKAAAIAGIIFSVLLITSLVLLRTSVPDDPAEEGAWLKTNARVVGFALNLIPFAGVAFLWFVGVLRDRLGRYEDRFFATIFLGSGLLFLSMLFIAAALAGAMLVAFAHRPELAGSAAFQLGRAFAHIIMNIYAIKMAGVFIITTSTLALYTGFAPRWIAVLGFGLASLLLLGSSYIRGVLVALPVWVFLLSVHILLDTVRRPSHAEDARAGSPKPGDFIGSGSSRSTPRH
jgi:MFS family permease